MAKSGAFSMLAETAEEFIQLECTRRRNQASLKRRSSLPSQFHVSGHKSRLKEKLAQARRHAFLLRADNKAALIGIVDNVRELANYGEEGGEGSKSAQRHNGPSPLERDRFISWAADVETLLFEFEPSENHANDPLLGVLEHLQFLQDGHVCLAEMAMDARVLLERWDRSGVFDSDSSSENDDDDDANDAFPDDTDGFLAPTTAKDHIRHLEKSYAYQTIRQRAAASIIKRNVLTWVRSKASFCERVAEIEIFGRTTEALLKELSLTSAVLAGNAGTDIFALATGRPKSRISGSIAFKDLLQFSKYMALFPVDQALRTVEDVTRRRYLFDARCAMKIQFVWRRVRETVRARRLRRAVEELRLQREQEAQAKREATKEAKKRKASEAGKRKVSKALKRSSIVQSTVIASAVPRLLSTATPVVDEQLKEKVSSPENREATADANEKRKPLSPPMPIDVSNRSRVNTSGTDDRSKPPSTPRSRQKASRGHATNNNDSDDDTTDVEAAWQSFMDTVATDMAIQQPVSEAEVNSALEEREPISPMPPVMLPSMDDNWESWSDEENNLGKNESLEACPLTAAKPRTPSAFTARTPRVKVVVSSNKSALSDPVARRPRKELSTSRSQQSRVPATPTSMIRPPSSLPFDATLQNHAGPYTGAGQLSLMAPFIDADRSKKTQAVVVPERKHLYEMDFSSTQRNDAAMVHIATALTGSAEPREQTQPPRPKTPEKYAESSIPPRTSSRHTTVARLRSITAEQEQTARIRDFLDPENRDTKDEQDTSATRGGNNSSKPGYFIYQNQDKIANIRREVVTRKGTMDYSPLTGSPDDEAPHSVEPGVKEMKSWHRSTISAIPQGLTVPHPPTDRFHPRHKKSQVCRQRKTITTEIADQIETLTRKTSKRVEKNDELPLLLRRSRAAARRREAKRLDVLPGDKESDIPAPDATKQMWKRGGELPEVALAQIRDRVGYKRRSSVHKRVSIIAGRSPPLSFGHFEEQSFATTDQTVDHPETIFPLDEEVDEDNEEDTTSEDEDEVGPEESDTNEDDLDVGGSQNNSNNGDDLQSDELSEELRRLHLASRDRELSGRRFLLSQLQDEEMAATNDVRGSSNDVNSRGQKRRRRRPSEALPAAENDEASSFTGSKDADAESALVRCAGDEDADARRRRQLQLRAKTRDAIDAPLEDEEDEEESDEEQVVGMPQQERDAAFQKLLAQYLGLLQCSPAEVARRLQVNI